MTVEELSTLLQLTDDDSFVTVHMEKSDVSEVNDICRKRMMEEFEKTGNWANFEQWAEFRAEAILEQIKGHKNEPTD